MPDEAIFFRGDRAGEATYELQRADAVIGTGLGVDVIDDAVYSTLGHVRLIHSANN